MHSILKLICSVKERYNYSCITTTVPYPGKVCTPKNEGLQRPICSLHFNYSFLLLKSCFQEAGTHSTVRLITLDSILQCY